MLIRVRVRQGERVIRFVAVGEYRSVVLRALSVMRNAPYRSGCCCGDNVAEIADYVGKALCTELTHYPVWEGGRPVVTEAHVCIDCDDGMYYIGRDENEETYGEGHFADYTNNIDWKDSVAGPASIESEG